MATHRSSYLLCSLLTAWTLLSVLVLAWTLVFCQTSSDRIRMKVGLVTTPAMPSEFEWVPGREPDNYRKERLEDIPESVKNLASSIVSRSAGDSAFERAQAIVTFLSTGQPRGEAVHGTFAQTLDGIHHGKGLCSDYVKAFLGLANAAGIPARHWGISFDSYLGWGHAFVEVYDDALGKWVMVDPFNAACVRMAADGMPLSALELREHLLAHPDGAGLALDRLDPKGLQFPDDAAFFRYYRSGVRRMTMTAGNRVFSFERHPLVAPFVSRTQSVAQLLGIAAGVYPQSLVVHPLMDPIAYDVLMQERRIALTYFVFLGAWLVASVTLGAVLVVRWRRARAALTPRSLVNWLGRARSSVG